MARGGKQKRGPPPSSPSVTRWSQADDIPLDDEEAFHAGKDKVLLSGGGHESDSDEDDFGGDRREVLGLGDSDFDEDDDSEAAGESEADAGSDDEDEKRQPRQYKRLEKEKAAREAAQISDEEEVELSDDEDDDATTRWGANKKAYYNTNNLDAMDEDSEIDEEEARRMELDEVKKLQARSRKGMEDSDFGLGEADVFGGAEEGGKGVKDRQKRRMELDGADEAVVAATAASVSQEALPTEPKARAQLLAALQRTSPETVALAGDYADAVEQLIRVESTLAQVQKTQPKHPALGMMHLHYQALYTYVTTLTFYFHLGASPQFASKPGSLSEHPVLARLLKLKEGLSAMEDLGFAVPLDGEEDVDGDGSSMEEDKHEVDDDIGDSVGTLMPDDEDEDEELGDLEDDELAGLLADKENEARAKTNGVSSKAAQKKSKKDAKTGDKAKNTKRAANGVAVSAVPSAPVAITPPLAGLLDADDSLDLTRRSASSRKKSGTSALRDASGESYGEATSMSSSEQADKAAKKHSLRFYTGQMDAKEQRRGQAARDRMGGDSDLPYRDRDRSRQAVEQARASREGKLKSASETALDNSDWGDGDAQDWRDVMGVKDGSSHSNDKKAAGGEDDDDDYYDLVSSGRKSAKRAKKESHDAERDSSRVILDDTISDEPGSHRAINRQISTNRGLSPHRKSDRNLRVKKRKKYEKAQKKLSSTRAVYKGGQGALEGGYAGEKSGINSAVAKSRRFAS